LTAGALGIISCVEYKIFSEIYQSGGRMKPAPVKPNVTIDDLQKLDIRVGTIESVEDVAGSKKLVKLTVSFGDHRRTILAGMKQEREDPTEVTGRQTLFVVNLAPRRMAGEVSQGMLFDLGYEDGITPVFAVPEKPVPDGTRVG
jgi:methionine--tRNA ligase beta chain